MDAEPPLFRAANGRPLSAQRLNRVCFGRWGADPGEEVVVCRIDPETVEICCHGGVAAVARIVRDLELRGARTTSWQESLHEQQSFVTAECLESLTQASTLRTAAILLEQSDGILERSFDHLMSLDGPSLITAIDELLKWSAFGLHLTRPWQVVLTGAPNVGKSSLINRLVGYQRSIVYAEPGTTRDVVTAAAVFDGWPVELSDTAGLREAPGEIEAAGIARARQQVDNADLTVIVLDRSRPVSTDEHRLLEDSPEAIVVAHKSDLTGAWNAAFGRNHIAVSSLTGVGIDSLIAAIITRLVPATPPPGTPIPVTPRQTEILTEARESARSGDRDSARSHLQRLVDPG
jgi:tRNA modification GTPase